MLYRHQREEELPASHDDDVDDEDDESGNENNSIGASSTDALDAALAVRGSIASFLSVMEGEGKEEGIIRQEAATRTDGVAGYKS
jgi:hypothetical protein